MQSLKELYRIGPGPSSSHTLAPKKACEYFLKEFGSLARYEVDLYGSLSLTGKGHFTDKIIENTLSPKPVEIHFYSQWEEKHSSGFYLRGYNEKNECVGSWTVFSLGGGAIQVKEKKEITNESCYPEKSLLEIHNLCKEKKWNFVDYVLNYEPQIGSYLNQVLTAMFNSIQRGLSTTGVLPGSLEISRAAKSLHLQATSFPPGHEERNRLLLMAYAYAASEENASCGEVVTAPTLGSCGVLASVLYHFYTDIGISRNKLINALIVAGVFGNLIKENATISGAIGGCQAEIGTACTMASTACAYLNGLNLRQIEYAAEIGMEHHLGLTCDPVEGYVIIPCIERNAVGALRAMDSALLAKYMSKIKENRITFDMIVKTMNYTGEKIAIELKETSLGGLATEFKTCHESKKINTPTEEMDNQRDETTFDVMEDEIQLEDHLVFDDAIMDENDCLTSPIKFKI